jgi:FtsZ-interacting cell division protein ZipA
MGNMSELQISLIAIGLLVVMGVILFNWIQQWRYRRGADQAFKTKHDDVLLKSAAPAGTEERIEPQIRREILRNDPLEETNGSETDHANAEPGASLAKPAPVVPGDPAPAQTAPHAETPVEEKSLKESPPARAPAAAVEETIAKQVHFAQPYVADSDAIDAIDYVVTIRAKTLIEDSDMTLVLQRKIDFNKKVRWLGQRKDAASWEEIATENTSKNGYKNLKGCLQLADRGGAVSEVNLSEFRDMIQNFAGQVDSVVTDCPSVSDAYAKALSLDQFCTKVDVMIGINIISRDASLFTAAKISVLAEASGFSLGPEGAFNYRDESHAVLFSLHNHESSPFLSRDMRTLTTSGITFLLDAPRVANGERAFDKMVYLATVFSDTLGGIMVDDNRIALSDKGISKIRQQLIAIQALMMTRNIPAGSEVALRLFT